MADLVKAKLAVEVIYNNLSHLPHPVAGVVRLVQFAHDSPGLRVLRRHVAEGLVLLLESNGWTLCNGLSEAEALLVDNGYAVLAPADRQADIDSHIG